MNVACIAFVFGVSLIVERWCTDDEAGDHSSSLLSVGHMVRMVLLIVVALVFLVVFVLTRLVNSVWFQVRKFLNRQS